MAEPCTTGKPSAEQLWKKANTEWSKGNYDHCLHFDGLDSEEVCFLVAEMRGSDASLGRLDCSGITFRQKVDLAGKSFEGLVKFDGATFEQSVCFDEAEFSHGLSFAACVFKKRFSLQQARVRDVATFRQGTEATFQDDAAFDGTMFDTADFGGVEFGAKAKFGGASFCTAGHFQLAELRAYEWVVPPTGPRVFGLRIKPVAPADHWARSEEEVPLSHLRLYVLFGGATAAFGLSGLALGGRTALSRWMLAIAIGAALVGSIVMFLALAIQLARHRRQAKAGGMWLVRVAATLLVVASIVGVGGLGKDLWDRAAAASDKEIGKPSELADRLANPNSGPISPTDALALVQIDPRLKDLSSVAQEAIADLVSEVSERRSVAPPSSESLTVLIVNGEDGTATLLTPEDSE